MAEEKKQESKLYAFQDADDFHDKYRKNYIHPNTDPDLLQTMIRMDKNGNRIASGMCICYIYQSADLRYAQ